jgi:hypothetical protein
MADERRFGKRTNRLCYLLKNSHGVESLGVQTCPMRMSLNSFRLALACQASILQVFYGTVANRK